MNNIIICGFMGAGKTVVSKELAEILHYDFIDMDDWIEQEQGITIKEIFEKNGEEYFRDLEHELCQRIANMQNCVVSTGGGTMTYERNVKAIKNGNKVVFLDASFPIITRRIGDSNVRPLFQDKEKAKKLYEERKSKYASCADYTIDGDLEVKETALLIADMIGGKS